MHSRKRRWFCSWFYFLFVTLTLSLCLSAAVIIALCWLRCWAIVSSSGDIFISFLLLHSFIRQRFVSLFSSHSFEGQLDETKEAREKKTLYKLLGSLFVCVGLSWIDENVEIVKHEMEKTLENQRLVSQDALLSVLLISQHEKRTLHTWPFFSSRLIYFIPSSVINPRQSSLEICWRGVVFSKSDEEDMTSSGSIPDILWQGQREGWKRRRSMYSPSGLQSTACLLTAFSVFHTREEGFSKLPTKCEWRWQEKRGREKE